MLLQVVTIPNFPDGNMREITVFPVVSNNLLQVVTSPYNFLQLVTSCSIYADPIANPRATVGFHTTSYKLLQVVTSSNKLLQVVTNNMFSAGGYVGRARDHCVFL